ncbi:lytic transglycosylase domain-containing protein [Dactylosporangium sp. CA-139066]|uniref:lytic transglycosylase domain-containing protein n=1 Tax=Dactylosporangium sp. CA-139066 TaxID=3239930 RepID=UPI003D94F21A
MTGGGGKRAAALGITIATAMLALAACGGHNNDGPGQAEPAESTTVAPEPVAALGPAAAAPSASHSPTPSRRPSTSKSPVVPSKDPAKVSQPLPPAPHPPAAPPSSPAPGASCPTYAGPKAPAADVRSALDAAAAKQFWPVSAPSIRLPARLLYAVAWQESGWQSTIVACDGGIGTMQIMPATATWMNTRFETSYDLNTLNGNVMIGGEYLAWLVKYFGDAYYQASYDLTVPAPAGGVSLLDSVVAAYNYGPGAIDPTKGRAGIPNQRYVDNVEALMTNCPCVP